MSFKVGIIGGAGYTAGELLRILVNHPHVEITWVQSTSHAGSKIGSVHAGLDGELSMDFCSDIRPDDADVVFLCKGHGESIKIMDKNPDLYKTRVIDLSQDFRLKGDHQFVYGLPELYKPQIVEAKFCASPGCFATCIQLGLLPAMGFLPQDDISIHTSGITGSTGAGQKLAETSHFSWRTHNASVYKPITHQHLNEVGEHTLEKANGEVQIDFIPYRGAFARGIITTSCIRTELGEDDVCRLYKEYYSDAAFTHVVEQNPDIKTVVNTNKCLVYPKVIEGRLVVVSVIDNLLKGASGQAVQNMNLMLGLKESAGLKLKASGF